MFKSAGLSEKYATSEPDINAEINRRISSTNTPIIVLKSGGLTDISEKSVKKGSQIYITGKIKTRSYVDKDGNNKYITEILGDSMVILEKKQGPSTTNQTHESGTAESSGSRAVESKKSNPPPASGTSMPDDSFDEGFPGGKNEDDLPF